MPVIEVLSLNQKLIRKTYNLCYRLTGDEVLAQDFCIKVFTGTQNNSQSIPTDFLHAAKTTVGMLWDSESSKQPRQSELIDSKREIQRALNALPIKERTAVVLKDVFKLTLCRD